METDYLIPFFEETWSLISNTSEMIMEKQTMNVSQKNKYIFGKWKESPEFSSCHKLNWEPLDEIHTIIPNARTNCDVLKYIAPSYPTPNVDARAATVLCGVA